MLNAITGLAAGSSVAGLGAQSLDSADAVVELDRQLNRFIVAHDVLAATAIYDDDFVLTVSGGGIKRKADMLADIGNAAISLTVCATIDVEVRLRGNAAVLTGTLLQAGTINGRAFDVRLRVTDTWVKLQGRWQLLAGHASHAK